MYCAAPYIEGRDWAGRVGGGGGEGCLELVGLVGEGCWSDAVEGADTAAPGRCAGLAESFILLYHLLWQGPAWKEVLWWGRVQAQLLAWQELGELGGS